ncbi:hypothetical protein ABK040_001961 [Willaertia magna]
MSTNRKVILHQQFLDELNQARSSSNNNNDKQLLNLSKKAIELGLNNLSECLSIESQLLSFLKNNQSSLTNNGNHSTTNSNTSDNKEITNNGNNNTIMKDITKNKEYTELENKINKLINNNNNCSIIGEYFKICLNFPFLMLNSSNLSNIYNTDYLEQSLNYKKLIDNNNFTKILNSYNNININNIDILNNQPLNNNSLQHLQLPYIFIYFLFFIIFNENNTENLINLYKNNINIIKKIDFYNLFKIEYFIFKSLNIEIVKEFILQKLFFHPIIKSLLFEKYANYLYYLNNNNEILLPNKENNIIPDKSLEEILLFYLISLQYDNLNKKIFNEMILYLSNYLNKNINIEYIKYLYDKYIIINNNEYFWYEYSILLNKFNLNESSFKIIENICLKLNLNNINYYIYLLKLSIFNLNDLNYLNKSINYILNKFKNKNYIQLNYYLGLGYLKYSLQNNNTNIERNNYLNKSLEYLLKCYNLDKYNDKICFYLSNIYIYKNDFKNSFFYIKKCLQLNNLDKKYLLFCAILFCCNDQYLESIKIFQLLLLNNKNIKYKIIYIKLLEYLKMDYLINLDFYDNLLLDLDNYLLKFKNNNNLKRKQLKLIKYYCYLSDIFRIKKLFDDALKYLDIAKRYFLDLMDQFNNNNNTDNNTINNNNLMNDNNIMIGNNDNLLNMINLLLNNGKETFDETDHYFHQESKRISALLYYYQGLIYQDLGTTTIDTNNTVVNNPMNSQPNNTINIDNNNIENNNYLKDALQYFELALMNDQSNSKIMIQLGINYYLQHHYNMSKYYLLQGIRNNPNHSLGWYYLGKITSEEENIESACEYYNNSLQVEKLNVFNDLLLL